MDVLSWTIGKPEPAFDIRVADENNTTVPAGEQGEIQARGDWLMAGYYNAPEATAEAITDGWLHTGDIGYLDEDGFIFLVDRMKDIIWPMLHNKFLQQDNIGFKLLLPIELSHMLRREDAEFYQQARLDKQNMVEKLEWTGATLYDIASRRLKACQEKGGKAERLTDLFEDDVSTNDIMDALDQMNQPRDAFKFLYAVFQEHCNNLSDDVPNYKVPKLLLDQIRKRQSQRVQDLQRGLGPA